MYIVDWHKVAKMSWKKLCVLVSLGGPVMPRSFCQLVPANDICIDDDCFSQAWQDLTCQ